MNWDGNCIEESLSLRKMYCRLHSNSFIDTLILVLFIFVTA